MGKRKNYTEEFKREAAKLGVESEGTLKSVADELGVSLSGLRKWIKEYGEAPTGISPQKMEKRLKELEKENRRLKMEREILKKATAFFAKEEL